MALGSKNIQTTNREHSLSFLGYFLLYLVEDLIPSFFILLGLVDGIKTKLVHFLHGEEFGVTTEHDVGTTTCHIGCNGYRIESTRLGDNHCLASVVLGV